MNRSVLRLPQALVLLILMPVAAEAARVDCPPGGRTRAVRKVAADVMGSATSRRRAHSASEALDTRLAQLPDATAAPVRRLTTAMRDHPQMTRGNNVYERIAAAVVGLPEGSVDRRHAAMNTELRAADLDGFFPDASAHMSALPVQLSTRSPEWNQAYVELRADVEARLRRHTRTGRINYAEYLDLGTDIAILGDLSLGPDQPPPNTWMAQHFSVSHLFDQTRPTDLRGMNRILRSSHSAFTKQVLEAMPEHYYSFTFRSLDEGDFVLGRPIQPLEIPVGHAEADGERYGVLDYIAHDFEHYEDQVFGRVIQLVSRDRSIEETQAIIIEHNIAMRREIASIRQSNPDLYDDLMSDLYHISHEGDTTLERLPYSLLAIEDYHRNSMSQSYASWSASPSGRWWIAHWRRLPWENSR